MEIRKTTGIALSSRASGEADIICNFDTKDFGKRRFIFKGLKKSKKRARSATEPGAVASMMFYHRDDRDYGIVNEFDIEKYHPSLTGDLPRIFNLYFILESVDKTCGYNVADEAIYTLLLSGIETLATTEFPAHLSTFFIVRLLKHHGILPETGPCKICGKGRYSGFE